MASPHPRTKIQRKVLVTILLAGILPGLLVLYLLYLDGRRILRETTGTHFMALAEETANILDAVLEKAIGELEVLGLAPQLQVLVQRSNAVYRNLSPSERRRRIQAIDRAWVSGQKDPPRLREVLHNSVARYFQGIQQRDPEEYAEIFATDAYGAVIAATNRTTDYDQSDETWWQEAFHHGEGRVYLEGIVFDESAGTYAVNLAAPIRGPDGRAQGVVKLVLNAKVVYEIVNAVRVGETGHANLLDARGTIQTCPLYPPQAHQVPPDLLQRIGAGETGWSVVPDDAHGGVNAIVGYTPVKSTLRLRGGNLPWYVFLRQDPGEADAPIVSLTRRLAVLGALHLLLLAALGYLMARRFVRPIHSLVAHAQRIGEGRFDPPQAVRTGDELETLSRAFTEMAARLDRTVSGLAEAHRRMERQNRELVALNRIAAVANRTLDPVQLLEGVLQETGAALEVDGGAAFLMEEDGQSLRLMAHRGLSPAFREAMARVPVEGSLPGRVARLREPVILKDLQGRSDIPAGLVEAEQVKVFLGIPLLSQETLVGVMCLCAHSPRAFSHQDVAFLASIGNQVGVALENANLYHRLQQSFTRLRDTQEQLLQAEKLAAVGQMVAGVAHELNNPLTGIIGFSELLLMQSLPGDVRSSLEKIHREGLRMQRIIQNLLGFARRHKVSREPVAVNRLLVSLLETMAYQFRVNNIRVVLCLAPDLPTILADPHMLQQVFLNLMLNAQQAMVEAHGRGVLTVATQRQDDRILIRLEDTGPGIPPEHRSRIFDPFFTTKPPGKGTGLGLSLVYGIVQEHGGSIRVDNREEGTGAVFTVTLPIQKTPPGGNP